MAAADSEPTEHSLKPAFDPDIVLIAQRNEFAGCMLDRICEVLYVPTFARVRDRPNSGDPCNRSLWTSYRRSSDRH